DSRVDDPLERTRLARVFEQGLGAVVGHALPMRPHKRGGWLSGPWQLRRERLYLLPGDSPMGYRLPVESLPWVAEEDYPFVHPRDPFASRPELPTHRVLSERHTQQRSQTRLEAAEFEQRRAEAELPP